MAWYKIVTQHFLVVYYGISEFPLVLKVKGPWDPQFQKVGGPFCFSGVPCLLLILLF